VVRARPGRHSQPGVKYKDWNDVLMNRPMQPGQQQAQPERAGQEQQPVAAHEVAPGITPANWSGHSRSAILPKH